MSSLPDALLLGQFRGGDQFALEALFERYERPIFQFLLGILRDHHLAEDALQETFVKSLLDSANIEAERFRGWVFKVAYREALQMRRRLKRSVLSGESILEAADPFPLSADSVEADDERRHLRSLLERLPKSQRDVIVARIYEGKRYREIANELGCPLNTALARMHEGLKKLRCLWEASHV